MDERGRKHVRVRAQGDRTLVAIRTAPLWTTVWLGLGFLCPACGLLCFTLYDLRGDPTCGPDWALTVIGAISAFLSARLAWRALLSRDSVSVNGEWLILRRGGLVLSKSERFSIAHIRRLRASPEATLRSDWVGHDPWQFDEGRNVAFDYGPRTIRFGLRLKQEEAEAVAAAIRERVAIPEGFYSYAQPAWAEATTPDGVAGPPAPRAVVEADREGLRIAVGAHRSRLHAVLGAIGMVGTVALVAAEVAVFRQERAARSVVIALELLPAGLFVAAARAIMWSLAGSEEMSAAADGVLTLSRRAGLARRETRIALSSIRDVRVVIGPGRGRGPADPWGRRGSVRLTAASGRYDFGVGLDEAEAEALVQLLREKIAAARSGAERPKPV